MYENFLINEICARIVDIGSFYRVSADKRVLKYGLFCSGRGVKGELNRKIMRGIISKWIIIREMKLLLV